MATNLPTRTRRILDTLARRGATDIALEWAPFRGRPRECSGPVATVRRLRAQGLVSTFEGSVIRNGRIGTLITARITDAGKAALS